MADDFGFFSSSEGAGAEEDPAAAFLAQQESEIAVIENDEGFGPTDGESATAPAGQAAPPEPGERRAGPARGVRWLRARRARSGLSCHPHGCKGGLCTHGRQGFPSRLPSPRGWGSPRDALHPQWVMGSMLHPQWAGSRVSPVDQACLPVRTIRGLCLVTKGLMLGFPLKPQDVG